METDKFDKILDKAKRNLDGFSEITKGPVLLIAAFIFMHALINKTYAELEDYNLKEKLPKPQNEVVVNDWDIAGSIRCQQRFAADFNRMYNELKGWEKIRWKKQPLDSANIYPTMKYPPRKVAPTLGEYHDYIFEYERKLYQAAYQRAKTKYANYKGKQK